MHTVGRGTFVLHALILYVSEGAPFELFCIHIVYMGTFVLYGLILSVSEGLLAE